MATTLSSSTLTSSVEADCRTFARQYPTPNVLAAVRYAESGRLTWAAIYELFRSSLGSALEEVR